MGFMLVPLGILAGWLAGAAMSRRMVREEVERLMGDKKEKPAAPATPPLVPPPPLAAAATPAPGAPPAPKPAEPEKEEEVSAETILILSAAVAAFLGKRARIRSARLVRAAASSVWAQQGRVFVQASHNLGVMHGR